MIKYMSLWAFQKPNWSTSLSIGFLISLFEYLITIEYFKQNIYVRRIT